MIVGIAAAASCTSGSDAADGGDPSLSCYNPSFDANLDQAVPTESLEDWKSYGDAVATMTIAEVENGQNGDPIVATVDEVHWQHPSVAKIPDQVEMLGVLCADPTSGDAVLRPRVAPFLDPGQPFIAPITDFGTWGVLTGGRSTIPVDDDGVLRAFDPRGFDTAADRADATTESEFLEMFDSTAPDPVAEANRDLDVFARFEAVSAKRPNVDVPAEGEF